MTAWLWNGEVKNVQSSITVKNNIMVVLIQLFLLMLNNSGIKMTDQAKKQLK